MSCFKDILTTFLGLECGSPVAVYAGSENILICVPKTNEGLMVLERHEGEQLMTEFSFLGERSL